MPVKYISDTELANAVHVMRENIESWKAGNGRGVCGLTAHDWLAVLDELQQRREAMRKGL